MVVVVAALLDDVAEDNEVGGRRSLESDSRAFAVALVALLVTLDADADNDGFLLPPFDEEEDVEE